MNVAVPVFFMGNVNCGEFEDKKVIENAGRFINSSIRLPIKKYYNLKEDIDVKLGEYDNIILIIRGLLTTLILNPLKLYFPLKLVDMRSENCC
jgi:hypothetical protein